MYLSAVAYKHIYWKFTPTNSMPKSWLNYYILYFIAYTHEPTLSVITVHGHYAQNVNA